MGAFFAFIAGYVVGMRAGAQGYEELRDAWNTIRESDEVKELVSTGFAIAADLLSRGRDVVADQMEERSGRALSPVA